MPAALPSLSTVADPHQVLYAACLALLNWLDAALAGEPRDQSYPYQIIDGRAEFCVLRDRIKLVFDKAEEAGSSPVALQRIASAISPIALGEMGNDRMNPHFRITRERIERLRGAVEILKPTLTATVSNEATGEYHRAGRRVGKGTRPGRPPGPKLNDKLGKAAVKMLDNGDVEKHERKWKDLVNRYLAELPCKCKPNRLRKRVEAIEAHRKAARN